MSDHPSTKPSTHEYVTLQKARLIAVLGLGFLYLYHGIVPKLWLLHPTELALNTAHGFPDTIPAAMISYIAGVIEVALGLWIILSRGARFPVGIATALLVILLIDTALFSPETLGAAFNPVTTNALGIALAAIIWISPRS